MPAKAKIKAERPPPAKKGKSLNERIVSKLKRKVPRSEAEGIVEVAMLRNTNPSRIRHILKTGIDSFDAVCGGDRLPGLPFGRIVELYGPEQSAKTAFAILSAVQAQVGEIYEVLGKGKFKKINPKDADITCLFFDNEGTLDETPNITINGTKLDCIVARCDTVYQMFKMVDDVIDEKRAEEKASKRPQFLVVVVDTIAGTSSKEEMQQDWGKDDFSRMPKQLRQGFRVLIRKISRNNVLFIATNQVGDNFKQKKKGAKGGGGMLPQESDFTSPGGRAVRFYARLRIFMQQAREEYHLTGKAKPGKKRFSAGFVGELFCKKNSQVPPSRGGRFVLLYNQGGLNNLYSKLEHLIFMKFAESDEDGGVTFLFKKHGVELKTFDKAAVESTLEEDDDAEEYDEDEIEDEIEDEEGDDEDAPRRKSKTKNPYLEIKSQWPKMYEDHKADFDALFKRCVEAMYEGDPQETEVLRTVVPDADVDDETDAADLEEENSEEAETGE